MVNATIERVFNDLARRDILYTRRRADDQSVGKSRFGQPFYIVRHYKITALQRGQRP